MTDFFHISYSFVKDFTTVVIHISRNALCPGLFCGEGGSTRANSSLKALCNPLQIIPTHLPNHHLYDLLYTLSTHALTWCKHREIIPGIISLWCKQIKCL